MESIMEQHRTCTKHDNRDLLSEFCREFNLNFGGTTFPHKDIHEVTWSSPDHLTQNQIDHITISWPWRRSLVDVRSQRGADSVSDHHLLIALINIKISKTDTSSTFVRGRKFDLNKLKEATILENFRRTIVTKVNDMVLSCPNVSKFWSLA